jgi:hypothetical protein
MTRAIELTLTDLHSILPAGLPCFGLLPDLEINSLSSAISAGCSAGFKLEGLALDSDQNLGQTHWTSQKGIYDLKTDQDFRKIIRETGLDLLRKAGEPLDTLAIYGACLAGLAEAGFPGEDLEAEQYFPQLLKDFEDNIAYRQGYLHYPVPQTWWHQEIKPSISPRSDQVEKSLVQLLVQAEQALPETIIYDQLYQEFPGDLTPKRGLIQACLNSYAHSTRSHPVEWKLKPNEIPARRVEDLEQIEAIVCELGKELGFEIDRIQTESRIIHLVWFGSGSSQHNFMISASGRLGALLKEKGKSGRRTWAILPGSRADLIHYKMLHNPPLATIINNEWSLVKFRHIRRLAETGGVTPENLTDLLELDPFRSDSPQLPLI